jgi:hypothetical protein
MSGSAISSGAGSGCGCGAAQQVTSWTPNCPANSSSSTPGSPGAAGAKGGFCLRCFGFWFWVMAAIILFLLLTHGGKKEK